MRLHVKKKSARINGLWTLYSQTWRYPSWKFSECFKQFVQYWNFSTADFAFGLDIKRNPVLQTGQLNLLSGDVTIKLANGDVFGFNGWWNFAFIFLRKFLLIEREWVTCTTLFSQWQFQSCCSWALAKGNLQDIDIYGKVKSFDKNGRFFLS